MQNSNSETQKQIQQVVTDLLGIDDRLAELAGGLILPPDVAKMWEGQIPACFTANLCSAIDAVRSDCIQDAVATLRHATGRTQESLRHQWRALRRQWAAAEEEKRRILQVHDYPGNSAGTKEPPQC